MENKQYVKKKLPVDAFQWNGEVPLDGPLRGKITEVYGCGKAGCEKPDFYIGVLETLEAKLQIQSGVWIVGPGARGEYWPVQDDIFRATYEEYDG